MFLTSNVFRLPNTIRLFPFILPWNIIIGFKGSRSLSSTQHVDPLISLNAHLRPNNQADMDSCLDNMISLSDIETDKMKRKLFHQKRSKVGNFQDSARVDVAGGKGGRGGISFEYGRSTRGKPNGGNGGRGGSVYLQTDPALDTLSHLPSKANGGNGQAGGKNGCTGAVGDDKYISVPVGTIVSFLLYKPEMKEFMEWQNRIDKEESKIRRSSPSKIESEETEDAPDAEESEQMDLVVPVFSNPSFDQGSRVLSLPRNFVLQAPTESSPSSASLWSLDMNSHPMTVVVAKGGKGGHGNFSLGLNNREVEEGYGGSSATLQFDLSLLGDLGLVGFPNAGKSSFLSCISRARPQIASYPFTTLSPSLGMVYHPTDLHRQPIAVADIPGLIEGASHNVGLGHEFLKHVIRCRALLFILDGAARDPSMDYQVLRKELEEYHPSLVQKPFLILINKMDLQGGDCYKNHYAAFRSQFLESYSTYETSDLDQIIFPLSALKNLGIQPAIEQMFSLINRT